MVDSQSVPVGGKMPARVIDLPVVPEARGEGEEAHPDPRAKARQGAGSVTLQPELALAGPKHGLDPLADRPERAEARLLVLAIGAQEGGSAEPHEPLELGAREALVGDDRVAGERDALE